MTRKPRDYNAEYQRRISRGLELGLSRSQARGHPRAGEPKASSPDAKPKSDEKVEAALHLMRNGQSMTNAAKSVRMSSKRLSTFLKAHKLARFRAREWIFTDNRPRRVPMIVGSTQKAITVPDLKSASRVGKYHNAVGRFIVSGDIDHLLPFTGESVTDIKGKSHTFETDPNSIFRFAGKDEPAFHEIYQIVSN